MNYIDYNIKNHMTKEKWIHTFFKLTKINIEETTHPINKFIHILYKFDISDQSNLGKEIKNAPNEYTIYKIIKDILFTGNISLIVLF